MMCERCWGDAYSRAWGNPMTDQVREYHKLLKERDASPNYITNTDTGRCGWVEPGVLQYMNVPIAPSRAKEER